MTAGSSLLFLSTFSARVALGDAPESVAGVKTLGILHAPGYPAYVLAARAFTTIEPFGSWTLRVNLFSLLCASYTIGLVYLIARRLSAGRIGAVVGSFTLATSLSYWFNAGFAKHYAFSALLVVMAAWLVLVWEANGRSILLVLAGALLGAGTGASWQLAAIMLVGLLVVVVFGARKPALGESVLAAALFVLVTLGLLGFIVLRARQDPTINWGDAHTVGRLTDVITLKDFALGTGTTETGASVISRIPARTASYAGLILHDMGLGALVLALVGAIGAWFRTGRTRTLFLAVVGSVNLLAAIVTVPLEQLLGVIAVGGFLIDIFFVIALLVALGTSDLVDLAGEWAAAHPTRLRQSHMTVARVRAAVVVVIAAVVLVPSLVVHYQPADHNTPAFTDQYARLVLTALPPNAVLVVGGYGYGLPILYRQIVFDERPDVTLIDGGTTTQQWYRDQLTRRYHLGDTMRGGQGYDPLVHLIAHFRETRPVFLDTSAMGLFRDAVGYRAEGFVGAVVDGTGGHPGTGLDAIASRLENADTADGLTGHKHYGFPNNTIYLLHNRAHVELAKEYFADQRLDAVTRELQRAVTLFPADVASANALDMIRTGDPGLAAYIKTL